VRVTRFTRDEYEHNVWKKEHRLLSVEDAIVELIKKRISILQINTQISKITIASTDPKIAKLITYRRRIALDPACSFYKLNVTFPGFVIADIARICEGGASTTLSDLDISVGLEVR
jgi:hypothetical protein